MYFLRPSQISDIFQLLGRFQTIDSESEVKILNERYCQSLHFTSLSDDLSYNYKRPMHKRVIAELLLKLAKLTLSKGR